MKSARTTLVLNAALGALVIVGAAACGGDDTPEAVVPSEADVVVGDDTAAATGTTDSAESTESTASALADIQQCMEDLGVDIVPSDETTTAFPPEYYESLGITSMLVFDKGAGWGGTIEQYASLGQAEVAEEGYADSEWGLEFGRTGTLVYKSTGPADDITEIESCIS